MKNTLRLAYFQSSNRQRLWVLLRAAAMLGLLAAAALGGGAPGIID
jgi:hypothetical protein